MCALSIYGGLYPLHFGFIFIFSKFTFDISHSIFNLRSPENCHQVIASYNVMRSVAVQNEPPSKIIYYYLWGILWGLKIGTPERGVLYYGGIYFWSVH